MTSGLVHSEHRMLVSLPADQRLDRELWRDANQTTLGIGGICHTLDSETPFELNCSRRFVAPPPSFTLLCSLVHSHSLAIPRCTSTLQLGASSYIDNTSLLHTLHHHPHRHISLVSLLLPSLPSSRFYSPLPSPPPPTNPLHHSSALILHLLSHFLLPTLHCLNSDRHHH